MEGRKRLARVKIPPVAKRLALREYLPLVGTTVFWGLVGLTIGHADAVRLLAAATFVQAVRAFFTLEVTQVLAGHIASDRKIYRKSRRLAWRIELLGMLVCLAVVALLALFLKYRGMEEVAFMAAIAAMAIPARHPGAILVVDRQRDLTWRNGSAAASFAGGILVFALGLHWSFAALVIALRDWTGLLVTALFAPPRKTPKTIPTEPLKFRHAASRTEAVARRRLSYRMMKSIFGVVLGPFGNLAARTGRGAVSLDTKIANFIPRNRAGMLIFALGTGAASVILLLVSSEPAAILGSAALARIAASAASALLWWKYGADYIDEDDDEE